MPAIAALVVGIVAAAGALASGLLPIPFGGFAATSASITQPATASISQNTRSPIEPVSDTDPFNETLNTNNDLSSAENQNTNIVHLSAEDATAQRNGRVLGVQATADDAQAPLTVGFLSQFSQFLRSFDAYLASPLASGGTTYPRYGGYVPSTGGTMIGTVPANTALAAPVITGGSITNASSGSFDALSASSLTVSGAATFGSVTIQSTNASSSNITDLTTTNATTSQFAISSISHSLIAADQTGRIVATTSIGANLIAGTLGTINGLGFNRGDSITLTAASSTLLANNNTFSGNNIFSSPLTLSSTSGTTTIASGQGFTIGSSQFVVQQGSGNVGIGTTTPEVGLSINTSTNWGMLHLVNTAAGGAATIAFRSADIANGASNMWFMGKETSANNDVFFIGTGATKRLTINTSGNVGIGTTTPGSPLSLNNIVNFTSATSTFYSTGGINLTAGCFAVGGNCFNNATNTWSALQTFKQIYIEDLSQAPEATFGSSSVGKGASYIKTTRTGGAAQYGNVLSNYLVTAPINTGEFDIGLTSWATAKDIRLGGAIMGAWSGANSPALNLGETWDTRGAYVGLATNCGNRWGDFGILTDISGTVRYGICSQIGPDVVPTSDGVNTITVESISIASPGVVTLTAHGFTEGMGVVFSGAGTLPSPLVAGTTYYVLGSGLTANTFQIASTIGGTAINTSGSFAGPIDVLPSWPTPFATVSNASIHGHQFGIVNFIKKNTIQKDGYALYHWGSTVTSPTPAAWALVNGNWQRGLDFSNATFSGSNIIGSNYVVDANGNFGIGTTTPVAPLHVSGSNGSPSLSSNTGQVANFTSNTTVQLAMGSINGDGFPFWIQTKKSLNSGVSFPLAINPLGGNVGIGTTTPSAQLTTTGTVRFSNFGAGTLTTDASGNLSVSSDERLKNIDGAFTRGLADVLQLSPISYHWNPLSGLDTATQYAGFSAQNVQQAIPEAVGSSTNGYLTLQDRPLIAAAINAIKELSAKLDTLNAAVSGFAERFTSKQVVADQLCAGSVCVNEQQLAALLAASGQSYTTIVSNQPSSPLLEPDNDNTATSASPAIDATAASSSPTTASSTPAQQPGTDNPFNMAATSTSTNDNASSASAAIVETAAVAI